MVYAYVFLLTCTPYPRAVDGSGPVWVGTVERRSPPDRRVATAYASSGVMGETPLRLSAMSTAQITDDDVGKTVVAEDGTEIGIVSGYRYGTAYVDPDPGLTTKLKTKLGWEDTDDDDGYPLQQEAVDTVTDDEIRLHSNL